MEQKQQCQKEVRSMSSKYQMSEKENMVLREQIKLKEAELNKVNQKYTELSNKLKNLITID